MLFSEGLFVLANKKLINFFKSLVDLLEETINHMHTGALDARIAQVTGYLTRIAIKAMEQADLEKRVEALEELVSERRS